MRPLKFYLLKKKYEFPRFSAVFSGFLAKKGNSGQKYA